MKPQRKTINTVVRDVPEELIRSAAQERLRAAVPILDWQGDEAQRKGQTEK